MAFKKNTPEEIIGKLRKAEIVLAQAGMGEEAILADIDQTEIGEGLAALDTDGNYKRPDIFELRLNRQKTEGVVFD